MLIFHLNYFFWFNFLIGGKLMLCWFLPYNLKKKFISSFYFPELGLSCGMQTLSTSVWDLVP